MAVGDAHVFPGFLTPVFQSYHGDNSHYSCLSWVSSVLGWGSEVSCPRTHPRKNPEDPVRLKPRTLRLRVKHFTTEPRRTPCVCSTSLFKTLLEREKLLVMTVFCPFGEVSAILIKFKIVVCKILSVWKSLKFVFCQRVIESLLSKHL